MKIFYMLYDYKCLSNGGLRRAGVSWQESRSFMAGNSKFGLRKLESPQKAQIKNESRAVSAALDHLKVGK
jgi:hypothetical protein